MAKNFNPADVVSVKIGTSFANKEEAGLAFLLRRNKRRLRRENRAI